MADEPKEKPKAPPAPKPQSGGGGENPLEAIISACTGLVNAVEGIPEIVTDIGEAVLHTAKPVAVIGAAACFGGIHGIIYSVAGATFSAGATWIINAKNKQETTYSQIMSESAIGALFGIGFGYSLPAISNIGRAAAYSYGPLAGLAAKSSLAVSAIPTSMVGNELARRAFVPGYEAKPMGDVLKRIPEQTAKLAIPVAASACLPMPYNLMGVGASFEGYRILASKPQKDDKKKPSQGIPGLPPGYQMAA